LPWARRLEGKKDFFFEKKKQKTFSLSLCLPDVTCVTLRGTKRVKVFWFFFSKKNIFLSWLVQRTGGGLKPTLWC
jgi:hypothetical protein